MQPGAGEASPYEGPPPVVMWNYMGGTLDWNALPTLFEVFDVRDPEIALRELLAIRDYQRRVEEVAARVHQR